MSHQREVLVHSSFLLAARLFSRLASLPFLLYAAATLGTSLFGVLAFTLATVDMLSALGDFGLSRYGARAIVREEGRRASLAGIILTLQLAASVVLTIVALAALLAVSIQTIKLQVMLLGLAAAFISSFVFTTDSVFTALKRFGASAVFSVIGRAIYLAAGFAALAAGLSVVAVMAAFLLGMAVESLLRMAYTAARLTPFSLRFSRRELVRVARGTGPFAVAALATLVYFRADTLIMELIRGDADVGIYNAAYSIFAFFVWAPIVLTRTLLPGLTRLFLDDPGEAERQTWFWYRITGAVSVPVAFVVTMLAGLIFRTLMPESFAGSAPVLQILMWSIPPLVMVTVGVNALVVTDRERQTMAVTVAIAVLLVIMDVILIWLYGPRGAAAAMVAATALWMALIHWLLRRQVLAAGHGLMGAFAVPAAAGALMALAALLASPLGQPAMLAAGLAAYGLAALLMAAIPRGCRLSLKG